MPKQKTSETYIKSIIKAFQIIEHLVHSHASINTDNEFSVHEISEALQLPPSTIQRILNTLQLKGYVIQSYKNSKYRLGGYSLYNLSKCYTQNLNWLDEAQNHIDDLVSKHKETVNIAALEGRNVVFLTKKDSPHVLRPNFEVGVKYPAIFTALGKCLLSFLPPESINILLKNLPVATTKKSLTNMDDIRKELLQVKKNGFAIDDEEFQEHLRCIAVPIKNQNMDDIAVASISISAPKNRMPLKRLYELKDELVDASDCIARLVNI